MLASKKFDIFNGLLGFFGKVLNVRIQGGPLRVRYGYCGGFIFETGMSFNNFIPAMK